MADPLSIIASAITVVGASITVADTIISLISKLRNAPEEVKFLQNDVTDTRLLLSNIKQNVGQDRTLDARLAIPDTGNLLGSPENIAKAEVLVQRIEQVLMEIDLALRSVTKPRTLNVVCINHGSWAMNRNRIKSLRVDLQELKNSLAIHFSASSSTHARRSVLLLKRMLLENARTVRQQTERSDQFDEILQDFSRRLAELSTVPESQRQLVTLLQNMNVALVASEESSRQTMTTTTTTTTTTRNNTQKSRDSPQEYVNSSGATINTPEANGNRNTTMVTTSSTAVSTESVSKMKVQFSRFQKRSCVPECECTCHQRRRYRSSSYVQRVFGEFFVGFSSLPLLSRPCTDDRCKERSPFSATFTYYLPTFLLNKMVSLMFVTTLQGDPAACIKIRPLSTDFSIYRAVECEDLGAVRSLLDRGLAHPSATFKGGWTALHYAISYGYTGIIKSLLAVGADPLLEDGDNQLSPLEYAWTRILGGVYENETQLEMEQLFGDRECLEEMRFTTLHRIILGLNPSNLKDHIAQNPGCIHAVDAHGRTPLSWAAQRGMVEAVETLLQCGADPNMCPKDGNSPLMHAAQARNPGCLRPLLDRGADVKQCDIEGQTALHHAACHRNDIAYYKPLLESGSDPNWPTKSGITPLATAIGDRRNEAVEYLIDNGADMNLKGQDDRSPVFYAVEYNSHGALKFLHHRGADFMGSSTKYPSIAHVAAHHANIETLRILTSYRLSLNNIHCVDIEGLTIPEILENRIQVKANVEDSFVHAFGEFLNSIHVDGSDEEEFHDAAEQIDPLIN